MKIFVKYWAYALYGEDQQKQTPKRFWLNFKITWQDLRNMASVSGKMVQPIWILKKGNIMAQLRPWVQGNLAWVCQLDNLAHWAK